MKNRWNMARGARAAAAMMAAAAAVVGIGAGAALAGATYGPRDFYDDVAAGDEVTYTITFDANRPAIVRAVGDGDIDIHVYDAAGNEVACDDESDAVPYVSWTPTRTQTYEVVVDNCEYYDVDFRLRTN